METNTKTTKGRKIEHETLSQKARHACESQIMKFNVTNWEFQITIFLSN